MGERRRKVLAPYAYLKEQIAGVIPISGNFTSHLEDLQKTLCSMEPMVYDMEQSESSLRHKFTIEFLRQLENANNLINHLLKVKHELLWYMPDRAKIDTIRKTLRDLFMRYVEAELDELARSEEVADEQVENALKWLFTYLRSKLSNELSKPINRLTPIFKNMDLTLDSLETELYKRRQSSSILSGDQLFHNTHQLHLLLNEVKLLLRFLKGDHGLDIPNLLLTRENRLCIFKLRDTQAQLEKQDLQYKELLRKKEKEDRKSFIQLATAGVVFWLVLNHRAESFIYPIIFVVAFVVAVDAFLKLTSDPFTTASVPPQTQASEWNPKSKSPRKPKKCEIFLNFRGSDARTTVAGLLYTNLERANICTFFDEKSILRTQEFWERIESAINTSKGAVIIFSKNYGDSEDCLDELLLIVKRKKENKNYIIRPIFYEVKPEDITDSESEFGQGLNKHRRTSREGKLGEYMKALKFVMRIVGHTYNSERQSMSDLIEDVVNEFTSQLRAE